MSRFEDTIKLDNLKEQLKSVASNIRDANADLEKTLVKKADAEIELAELIARAESVRGDIGALIKAVSITEHDLRQKRAELEELTSLSEQEMSLLKDTERERRKVESSIAVLSREKAELEVELDSVRDERDALDSEVEEITSKIRFVSDALSQAYGELDETTEATSEVRAAKEREVRELEDEIARLKEKKSEEDAKIVIADEYIKRKESDIAVVTRRLQSIYQEVKPGVALKI